MAYESQLKYYYKNKDKINQGLRNNKKVCECGSSIPKGKQKRHYGTKKHQLYLEAIKLIYIYDEPETCENNTENRYQSNSNN